MKTETTATTSLSDAQRSTVADPISAAAEFEAELDNLFAEVTEDAGETPEPAPKAKAKPKATPAPKEPEAAEETEDEAGEEETAEEGTDEEEDKDDAAEEKAALRNPDKFQAILDARRAKLHKAREERDAVKAEAEELRQQLTALQENGPPKPVLLTPTGQSPLADVHSEEQLQQAEANANAQLSWCRKNREGGVLRDGTELTADQVATMEDRALDLLRTAIPARQRYLAAFREDLATATKTLPFMSPNHALHKDLAAFGDRELSQYPDIATHPRHVSNIAKVFAFDLLASGTHQLIPRADGTLQLVSVTKPGTTPTTAKATTTTAKPPATRPVSAPPPQRRDTPGARLADRIASSDPHEAFDADMEDFFAAAVAR